MQQLPNLPSAAFDKVDRSPDAHFYRQPRFVEHIDDGARAAVSGIYAELLPAGSTVLDLMSSWVSHLPEELHLAAMVGHGMNAAELAANSRLSQWFVQDLNADPILPLDSASFDAVCLCVSVQYLERPVEVFSEVARVLRPGAPFIVSFSNRCFPTKAVAIWRALPGSDQQGLVSAYMEAAGIVSISFSTRAPAGSDPLWVVIGRAPNSVSSSPR